MLYLFHLKACSKMDQLAKQFNISGGKKKRQRAILDKGEGSLLTIGCWQTATLYTFLHF